MTSIFENTSSPVTIHLLHDETLTQDNREKFIRTSEKYSQEIDFIDMSKYSEYLNDTLQKISGLQKRLERLTRGALYRAFIPQLLPNIDKIIYLDCDVVVNLDISELWKIDLENKSLAGVLAPLAKSPISLAGNLKLKLCGIEQKNYINSGVLLINIEKMRKNGNFSEQVTNWLLHYHYFAPALDQAAINSILAGDIKIIDSRFNLWNLSKDVSNSIIHMFAGKPWKGFTGRPHEKLYWRMYLKSAWGENCTIDNFIDKISALGVLAAKNAANNPFIHEHGSQCVKRLLHGILRRLRFNRLKDILETLKLRLKYRHLIKSAKNLPH